MTNIVFAWRTQEDVFAFETAEVAKCLFYLERCMFYGGVYLRHMSTLEMWLP